jgi:hypothetical protein
MSGARRTLGLLAGLTAGLAAAAPALAVQTHGAPEGLYAHQIGHMLFAAALVVLYVKISLSPLAKGPGWGALKLSCVFFFLWNVATFANHWLEEARPGPLFNGGGGGGGLWGRVMAVPATDVDLLAYLVSFDHLLCVPAMVFFVLGLKRLAQDAS